MAKKKRKTKRKAVRRKKTTARKKTSGKRKSGLTQTKYGLSPELQAVCGGAKSLTRPEIVKKMWHYIKAHKCQDTKNRRMINPDKKLSEVIGKRPVDMLKLAGCLSKHIK
jgi:chromatin remodeling complex protein RSC6